jgi:hypothetical protein
MRDPLPISITVSDPWDVGEAANCRQSMVSCYNCRRPTTAARPLVRFDHEIVYRGAAYRYAVAAPRLDSIPLSTVGTRLLILLVALSIPLVMETLKNLWLNWGWSHPFASSVAVALIAVAAWWLFGLIVTLATPQSPTQGASPAPSATPQNIQQSATASDGSTINQVGGDLTINQGGLSDEDRKMLRDLVKKKSVDGMAEFAQRYRHGYLIFGLSPNGGPVTYQGELRDARIDVDWSNLRSNVQTLIGCKYPRPPFMLCLKEELSSGFLIMSKTCHSLRMCQYLPYGTECPANCWTQRKGFS